MENMARARVRGARARRIASGRAVAREVVMTDTALIVPSRFRVRPGAVMVEVVEA
jgi:hypothetical protein